MTRLRRHARLWAGILVIAVGFGAVIAGPAGAVPYAEIVIDARNGQVIRAQNADARLAPASLTKMMTLYVTFDAINRGEIGLDDYVTVSKNAAKPKSSPSRSTSASQSIAPSARAMKPSRLSAMYTEHLARDMWAHGGRTATKMRHLSR